MGRNHITDNEFDLLNKVKLTAVKQLHYSSKRKGGLGPWENVGRGNRQSPTSFNGSNQNALRVQSEIPASSAFISQACNQRKTLGSPESNVGARTGIHWALHMSATVLSHLQASFSRFLLLGDVALTLLRFYISLKGVKGSVQAYLINMWSPGRVPRLL